MIYISNVGLDQNIVGDVYTGIRGEIADDQIPPGFIRIPNLVGFDIVSIIDTLESLKLNYKINYYSNEFKQLPDINQIIMLESEKVIIYHPSPGP